MAHMTPAPADGGWHVKRQWILEGKNVFSGKEFHLETSAMAVDTHRVTVVHLRAREGFYGFHPFSMGVRLIDTLYPAHFGEPTDCYVNCCNQIMRSLGVVLVIVSGFN